MASEIHATAEVHPTAVIGDNARVEAGACIEAGCVIGGGTTIGRNSIIWRGTRLGDNNHIYPFCSIGGAPQDKKYKGEDAPLIIGDNNTIREYCLINKGTAAGGKTVIGSGNWIMGYAHIAHDCVIGGNTIIANATQIAGHVEIGDNAVLSGGVLIHQFRRIGAGAMVGGGEALRHDVPPHALVGKGVVSVNVEGLRRRQKSPDEIRAIRAAYKTLYRGGGAARVIADMAQSPYDTTRALVAFLQLPDLRLIRPSSHSPDSSSSSPEEE